jgi:hypothetical protein
VKQLRPPSRSACRGVFRRLRARRRDAEGHRPLPRRAPSARRSRGGLEASRHPLVWPDFPELTPRSPRGSRRAHPANGGPTAPEMRARVGKRRRAAAGGRPGPAGGETQLVGQRRPGHGCHAERGDEREHSQEHVHTSMRADSAKRGTATHGVHGNRARSQRAERGGEQGARRLVGATASARQSCPSHRATSASVTSPC